MTEKQRDLSLYLPVYLIAIVIYIIAGIVEPAFFTWNNNINLFTRITPLVLAGLAQTFVMLTGGIDLSIGSIISLTNVISVSLIFLNKLEYIIMWLFILPLLGLAMGLINGFIITKGGFPPLIVTLATGAIWQGVALIVMPIPVGEVDLSVSRALIGKVFNLIPSPLLIFLFFIFISYFILKKTEFGRSIYALGGNETIAYESGIPCKKIKFMAYGVSGILGAFTGLFISAWIFSGDALVGKSYTLNSIAVAVIGGVSLSGGKGGVLGIIGGVYIFLLISNILNLWGISTFYQYVVKGLIIIFAMIISVGGLIELRKFLVSFYYNKIIKNWKEGK
jgi:ribose transport system permease protein